jgi:hypothetical protein
MARRKLELVGEIQPIEMYHKPSNDATIEIAIEVNGNVEQFVIVVREFCCQVVKPKQIPSTVLDAVMAGLESHFGKRASVH